MIRKLHAVEILEACTGGTRRHLLDLLTGLDRKKFELSLICSAVRDPSFLDDIPLLEQQGIRVVQVPMTRDIRPFQDFQAYCRIYRQIRQWHPDIVHTHSSKAGFLGRLAARQAVVPRIFHTPHGFSFEMEVSPFTNKCYFRLEKLAARWANRMICVCPAEKTSALRRELVSADKLTVIPNGTDPPPPLPVGERERRRLELGLGNSDPVVGMIGRFTRQKGQTDLLLAAVQLVKIFPGIRFVMIGDGEDRPILERMLDRFDLRPFFVFTGWKARPEVYFPAFDVVVIPSRWEALPYVLLDAMATGCAVVATAVGGMADVIADGSNGLLVEPRAPTALAGALNCVLSNPLLGQRLGTNARDCVTNNYTLSGMLNRIETLYQNEWTLL